MTTCISSRVAAQGNQLTVVEKEMVVLHFFWSEFICGKLLMICSIGAKKVMKECSKFREYCYAGNIEG